VTYYCANVIERQALISGIRELAGFLESKPDVPAHADVLVFPPSASDYEKRREVNVIASLIGSGAETYSSYRHYAADLRGLRGIWIDAGVEENLIRFELFDATHSGIDYRYPLSLAWLCERMADLLPGGARRGSGYSREVSSATISAADCDCLASATLCPAHIESASMSPVVPTIGGAGS
jgi:hypothetical protein